MSASVRAQFFPKPGDLIERVREERKRLQLEKSTREALSEEPGEPIALPAGHGPAGDGPRQAGEADQADRDRCAGTAAGGAHHGASTAGGRDVGPEHGPAAAPARGPGVDGCGRRGRDEGGIVTRECSQETGWKIAQAQIALAAKRTPEERSAMAKRGWADPAEVTAIRQPLDRARIAQWHRVRCQSESYAPQAPTDSAEVHPL